MVGDITQMLETEPPESPSWLIAADYYDETGEPLIAEALRWCWKYKKKPTRRFEPHVWLWFVLSGDASYVYTPNQPWHLYSIKHEGLVWNFGNLLSAISFLAERLPQINPYHPSAAIPRQMQSEQA